MNISHSDELNNEINNQTNSIINIKGNIIRIHTKNNNDKSWVNNEEISIINIEVEDWVKRK